PGSHCGNNKTSGSPGVTGMVSRTDRIRRSMSWASTASRIVPEYGTSRGVTIGGGIATGCGPLDCEYRPAALAASIVPIITVRLKADTTYCRFCLKADTEYCRFTTPPTER